MTYYCDQCGSTLPGGAKSCPHCGKIFNDPVPIDLGVQGIGKPKASTGTESSLDALLRSRTAGGASLGNLSSRPVQSVATSPSWYGSVSTPRQKRPVWHMMLAVATCLIAILALAGWGANTLWMRGRGGDIAFMQHNLKGNAAAERGDFQQADDEYGQMIALRPHRDDGYLLRAISEMKEGHLVAAMNDNTAALDLVKDPMVRGDLFYNRAQAHGRRGEWVSAISDYTQADSEYKQVHDSRELPEVPDRIEGTQDLLADAHWEHKDYALAVRDSSAAMAFGHPHPDYYGVRAKAEAALGQDQSAKTDFHRALQLDLEYMDAYVELGKLAEKEHQYAQAVAVFQQATRVMPDKSECWGSLGWFQYESGQFAPAIISDQHAQALNPNQPWVNYNLALTYAASGQGSLSKEAYAYALSRSSPADRQPALTDIRNALTRQPNSLTLRLALEQVLGGNIGRKLSLGAPRPALPIPSVFNIAVGKSLRTSAPKPPAAYASLLAPEIVIDGYGIQPPAGYTLTQSPEESLNSSSKIYLWTGPQRADGTAPTLQVVIGQDDGTLAAHSTQTQVMQLTLANVAYNHTNVTTSPVKTVVLNGLSFASGSWDGIGQRTGLEYQGSEYWLVSPSHLLHLTSHDAAPYSHITMQLLKASILTFRKV